MKDVKDLKEYVDANLSYLAEHIKKIYEDGQKTLLIILEMERDLEKVKKPQSIDNRKDQFADLCNDIFQKVQRFDISPSTIYEEPIIYECPDEEGKWVKFEDIEKMIKKICYNQ